MKSSVLQFEFTKGHDIEDKKTLEKINTYLQKMESWNWKTAWLSGDRYTNSVRDTIVSDVTTIFPASIVLMLLSLFLSFRSVGGTIIPFVVVLISLIMTAAVMGLTGIAMNTVTVALPALLICVGNDYAIHFLNYYFEDIRSNPGLSKKEVVFSTLGHLITPLSVTALTTVVGFSALMISDIPAIRHLGLFASVGVIVCIFMTLTFLPSILLFLPRPKAKPEKKQLKSGWFDQYLEYLSSLVEKHPLRIMKIWLVIALIGAAGIGLIRIDGDVNPLPADHPMEKDRIYFWDNFIGDDTLYMYFEPINDSYDLQSAEFVYGLIKLKKWLLQEEGSNQVSTLSGLRVDRFDSPIDYIEVYRNGLDDLKDDEVKYFHSTVTPKYKFPIFLSNDTHLARAFVQFGSSSIPSTLKFTELTEQKVKEYLPGVNLYLQGRAILMGEAQHNLATGQLESVTLAMFMVFIILSLLFMSVKIGMLAVLPNIIPIVIFFGTLGYADIPIGFTISLIAAIVLGIGVDDTIHYLTHFNSNLKKIRNEKEAALLTVKQTGRPMTYTTLSLGLGFIIFLLSDMFQQKIFGVLTAYIFVVCLATDLNFLPAVMSKVKLTTFWDFLAIKFDKKTLASISLFNNMSMRESKLATLMAYTVDLKKDERLLKEGDYGDELYVILKGKMEVFLEEEFHGKRISLAQLVVGQPFGEMGLFRESKRSASCTAMMDTQLLVLKKSVLEKLQKRYPKIATKLFFNLATNLAFSISKNSELLAKRRKRTAGQFMDQPEQFRTELKATIDQILAEGFSSWDEKKGLLKSIESFGTPSEEEYKELERLKVFVETKISDDEVRIEKFIDSVLEQGVFTYEDKKKLDRMIYEDYYVTDNERAQLERLDKAIETGSIRSQVRLFDEIFQKMTPSQANWMKKHFEIKTIPANSTIYSEGEHGDYLLVSLKGKFNLFKTVEGKSTPLMTLFEGDLVGAVSLLCSQSVRSSSVATQEGAMVIFINREGLETMENKKPRLAARFYYNTICMLSDRLVSLNAAVYE